MTATHGARRAGLRMNAIRWAIAALCLTLAAVHARADTVTGAGPSAAASRAQASDQAPDKVAHDFYAWYLGQLAKNQDPITLKAPPLQDYVSPALLADIDRQMNSADGMDADYFLKTQDYLDGWLAHVAVGPAKVAGRSATALVTLGAPTAAKDEIWRLRVTLALGVDGHWKIRSVAKV